MLQQREADLKNQFEKFNTIGARELEAQSREQETRLPLQFRAHAQMQYKQHIYAAKEIKNLLDRLWVDELLCWYCECQYMSQVYQSVTSFFINF